MQTLIQDLRFAGRQLRHSPEFTLLAVVTLALGIGANTAMFTVVENVLLRPLPYAEPDRLVQIAPAGSDSSGAVSWLDYVDVRSQSRTLRDVAGYSNDAGVVQTQNASVSVVTSEVTPNLFRVLAAQPLRGRTFTEDEGKSSGAPVVLLSEILWRQAFAADPSMVGRTVRVNGRERTVVGVMPRGFRFPESAGPDIAKGLWLPMQPTSEMLKDRGYHFFTILAKPMPGATLGQVQAELALVAKRIRDSDSHVDPKFAFRAVPYSEIVTGPVHAVLLTLLAALGLVLLIACANVANLLIARCLGRQHEFAVRVALGSGRGRLISQMVAEAGLLSVLGCALGFVMAYWITAAVQRLPAGTIPRADAIAVRWTVLLVLGVIATATTVLSALLPALFVARTDPQTVLQAASRSLGTRSVRARVGGWLVAGEVSLSVLLLVATGLLFRTLWNLEHTHLGFDTTRVTSFSAMPADASGFGNMTMTTGGAPASVATSIYRPLLEALRNAPGVRQAALITAPPFSGFDLQTSFGIVGRPLQRGQNVEARLTAVSGDYERLMRTPVLRGRDITERDTANARFVATINETLARRYFGARDALGQQLDLGGAATGMLKTYTVVGIIADQVDASTSQPARPLLMLPYQQIPATSLFYPGLLKTVVHFVIKTKGDIEVAPEARAIVHQIAPDLALDSFQTMQEAVNQSNFSTRLGLYLIATFAGLAVLMVIAGLYGVLAQVVSHRRREFGVRMALGATRQNVIKMVLLQGSAIIAPGLVLGMLLSLSTDRLTGSFLYGVKSLDASTYVSVAAVLLVVGALAALVPAWRAASFEPTTALRDE